MAAKFVFCIILQILLVFPEALYSQDYESYKRQQQEVFQSYKLNTQEQWDEYRRKANEEFAEQIKKPWVSKRCEKPRPEPASEPDIPPVIMPEFDIDIIEDNSINVEINYPIFEDKPIQIVPIPYRPKPVEQTLVFTFYGTKGSVHFDTSQKSSLNGCDEKAVSSFWKELSGEAYDNIVSDCQKIKENRDLCDWAYYRMTEKVANMIYDARNERVVFHAWLLTQSGFSIRLGRENGNLHLLPGTNSLLFGKPFWKLRNGYYSLLDNSRISSMFIMDIQFPNSFPLRTRMFSNNSLEKNFATSRNLSSKKYPEVFVNVSCDKNTLSLLQDIPVSATEGTNDTDYLMYAGMPLSEKARKDLYPILCNQLAGKTESEAVNILLDFVQTAFDYKTDGEVWGHERPFFPEETLYYPYSDCEDRAILFVNLVQEILKMEVAFVSYPGHLAAAVHFKDNIQGDYFVVNGKRYLICDPTYINAPIGRTMPGMNNATAKVYLVH